MDEKKVVYICDKQRCKHCRDDFCIHTSDIKHAKNFELNGDVFLEKTNKLEKEKIQKVYDVLSDILYKYDGKKKPLKVEMVAAMEEAVEYLREALE